MYSSISTRILQDVLKAEQVRLETTKNEKQRGIIMDRIRRLAGELLKRWKNESQTLMG